MKATLTIWPDVEVEIDETEYNDLKAQGLIADKQEEKKDSKENK